MSEVCRKYSTSDHPTSRAKSDKICKTKVLAKRIYIVGNWQIQTDAQKRKKRFLKPHEIEVIDIKCISRESNTGPIDGNDGFYH